MGQQTTFAELAQAAASALDCGRLREGVAIAERVVSAAREAIVAPQAELLARVEAIEALLQVTLEKGEALLADELDDVGADFELMPPAYALRRRLQRVASDLHVVLRPAYDTLFRTAVTR